MRAPGSTVSPRAFTMHHLPGDQECHLGPAENAPPAQNKRLDGPRADHVILSYGHITVVAHTHTEINIYIYTYTNIYIYI